MQHKFIMIIYQTMNMKGIKQGYGTRLYFILMLNKLKIIEGPTFVYNPLGT